MNLEMTRYHIKPQDAYPVCGEAPTSTWASIILVAPLGEKPRHCMRCRGPSASSFFLRRYISKLNPLLIFSAAYK